MEKNGIEKETKQYTIEFTTPMLGTVCKNKEVYATYIASKAPIAEQGAEEVCNVTDIEEKGWTGFLCDESGLYISAHMVLGFLKNACKVMVENGCIKKITAYKSWFDSCVFVGPRKIHFGKQEPDGVLERPLRAMTMQGPRVTLARSDLISEGTRITFDIEIIKNTKGINHDIISTVLEYGQYVGLGQWRGSGGYGRFVVVE